MAVLRSDIIIPEVFTPYVIEQTTAKDAFLSSGVVTPMAELNATEGGDFVNVPSFSANLLGDFERLTDSSSLTPSKIGTGKQIGVILHRGKAFESRDLAALAAGADPMAAIAQKVGAFVANQRQKDLLACLDGVFGLIGTNNGSSGGDNTALNELTMDNEGTTASIMSPRHVARAKALLGDAGDKLSAVCVHSAVYYDLVERKLIDYVLASDVSSSGSQTTVEAGGTIAAAYGGDGTVPTYCGLRVIVSDDVPVSTVGRVDNNETIYGSYFFTQGAIGSGEQAGLTTETDRDILAKSDAMAIDLHYCYHPIGTSFKAPDTSSGVGARGPSNPTRDQLKTSTNWSRVFELKNIGIVRASNKSSN